LLDSFQDEGRGKRVVSEKRCQEPFSLSRPEQKKRFLTPFHEGREGEGEGVTDAPLILTFSPEGEKEFAVLGDCRVASGSSQYPLWWPRRRGLTPDP